MTGPALEILSALVLLTLLRLAEPVLAGAVGYDALAIHPYWAAVILAAALGGLVAGLPTALLATLLMSWPARGPETGIVDYYAAALQLPILWITTALLLGGLRQRQIAREAGIRAENEALERDNALLTGEIGRLDAAVARMELAAATGISPGEAAIAVLADLGAGAPGALERAARQLTGRPGLVVLPGAAPIVWGLPAGYEPPDPGAGAGAGPLPRPMAGCTHAARASFETGHLAILTDDQPAAEAALPAARVLAQALDRAARMDRQDGPARMKAAG